MAFWDSKETKAIKEINAIAMSHDGDFDSAVSLAAAVIDGYSGSKPDEVLAAFDEVFAYLRSSMDEAQITSNDKTQVLMDMEKEGFELDQKVSAKPNLYQEMAAMPKESPDMDVDTSNTQSPEGPAGPEVVMTKRASAPGFSRGVEKPNTKKDESPTLDQEGLGKKQ